MLKNKQRYNLKKEYIISQTNLYKENLKDDFHTLYYLKEEHYIGLTNQPVLRMQNHKRNGKYIADYEVVDAFKNKREALDAEQYMHSIGYNGANPRYKLKK